MSALGAMPTLVRVGFAGALAYRAELVVWMLTTTTPLVSLALWSAVSREAPLVSRTGASFDSAQFTAYFLTTLVVRQLTGSWVVWELNENIRSGTLSVRLLRPLHPLWQYLADALATLPLRALFCVPIVLGLQRGLALELAGDPGRLALAATSLALAFVINFAINASIGALAFWLEASMAVYQAWLTVFMVLSGYLVPLALLPARVASLSRVLPLRATLATPVELLTGSLRGEAALVAVLEQGAWAAALVLVALALFRRGTERFAAFGG